MGALMTCCEAICCCASIASCFSCCCKSCPTSRSSIVTRVIYAVLLLLSAISAWTMLDGRVSHWLAESYFTRFEGNINCTTNGACDAEWGHLGVSRTMWACAIFFGFFGVIMFGVKSSHDGRAKLQNGWWGIKVILLTILMFLAFFIENTFFVGWGYFALVCSFLFILVQLILLVDFSHSWASSWMGKVEDGQKCYLYGLISISLVMYITSFVLSVIMFVYYTKNSDGSGCGTNKFFIGFNLALNVVCTVLAILPRVQEANPRSGILQSGVVSLYCSYLTWSAVSNAPDTCKPQAEADKTTTVVIGALLTFVVIIYSALQTSSKSHMSRLSLSGSRNETETVLLPTSGHSDSDDSDNKVVSDEHDGVAYNWSFFHFTFMCASLYLTMVLTNWNILKESSQADTIELGNSTASIWVKIVSSWICVLLYVWSLIAPVCLPNRDFS